MPVIKQTPKDLHEIYPKAKSRKGEMEVFIIQPNKNEKSFNGKILQTSHCLEIMLSGTSTISDAINTQKIRKGDIQFRKRGNYIIEASNDYSSIIYFFENPFIINFLNEHVEIYSREVFVIDIPPFIFKLTPFIQANVNETIDVITKKRDYSACISKFSLHQILLQILDKEKSVDYVTFLKYLISSRKLDLPYYMETNFTQNLDLKTLARQTGRSLSSFKKEFSTVFGTSPKKWLINRRLTYAKYLVKSTTYSISDIAYESGFENVSHFSKVYRDKYGNSPSETRK